MSNSDKSIKVAISDDFLKAFSKIPSAQQAKVSSFVEKFRSNPTSNAINYEKLHDIKDDRVKSVRIDQAYRGIVLKPDTGNVYLLVWVDHHDKAYKWAKNKTFAVNPHTGSIQLMEIDESIVPSEQAEESVKKEKGLFNELKDKHLLKLGIPEPLLALVRSMKTDEDLERTSPYLPEEASEALFYLAMGYSYEDTLLEMMKDESDNQVDTDDFASALDNPDSQRRFWVVEDSTDLYEMLNAPLDKWRVFLHPAQRKLVEMNANGPVRVLGGAGTGKTVVAIHRAKWLAQNIHNGENDRILFTTFTKNLSEDIRDNLKKICPTDLMKRIDVINIDAWVTNFLRKQDYDYKIAYIDKTLEDVWDRAYILAPEDLDLPKEFYKEEWSAVIQNQGIADLSTYMRASRLGRGRRLSRGERKKIWPVFEEYRSLLNSENRKEFVDAARDAKDILKAKGDILPYKAVIIDEAQDMSPEVFRLIRQIVPEDPEKNNNDIFIVGDAHQRIYEHRIVLSHCGVNIRGRGRKLKINYRTTEETRKWAEGILENCSIDDLDGGEDNKAGYKSITHGDEPVIKEFPSFSDEVSFLKEQLSALKDADVNLNSVCLVARTHKLLDQYQGALNAAAFELFEIKHSLADDTRQPGLRIATMHRVKGIEFDYIFIAGVNDDILPLPTEVDDNETSQTDHETKERALLYVAATRARKGVTLTSFGNQSKLIKRW